MYIMLCIIVYINTLFSTNVDVYMGFDEKRILFGSSSIKSVQSIVTFVVKFVNAIRTDGLPVKSHM